MIRFLIVIELLIWAVSAKAGIVVKSCDDAFVAKNRHGSMIIERGVVKVGEVSIDHDIDGGVFSLDDYFLVVFGVPNNISGNYPQETRLSVYRVSPEPMLVVAEVYGGGVYDASFSSDQKFVVVENQYGIDVLDLENNRLKSFDLNYVPDFSVQKCRGK